jgi:hypothetical protein
MILTRARNFPLDCQEELGAFSQNREWGCSLVFASCSDHSRWRVCTERLAVQLLTEREPKVKHAQAVVAVYVWKPDEFCLDDSPSETVVDTSCAPPPASPASPAHLIRTSWHVYPERLGFRVAGSVARFRIELGKICWKDTAELLPHMSVAQRSTSADFSVAPSPLDMEKLVWDQDQATDQVVAPTLEVRANGRTRRPMFCSTSGSADGALSVLMLLRRLRLRLRLRRGRLSWSRMALSSSASTSVPRPAC